MKNEATKRILLSCSAFVATAVMLTVIQPPISWAPLAWISLVPFILACSPTAKPKSLALAAYLISLCYWLANLYWMCPVTWPGWLAFCLYTALLWPILALCLRYCRIKRIPLLLAVPVLFVGAERLQGLFLGGFFWRFLAHSQYANITLIQIADIFGAAGLSFLIAMVNALLADLIIAASKKNIFKTAQVLKTIFVCALLVATILYGQWRINQSPKFTEDGPLVAALQSNVPQSVKESFEASDVIFDELLQNSRESAKTGAELIVWPETMVQAILNTKIWPFLASSETEQIFHKALSEHAKDTAFLLVGTYAGQLHQQRDSFPVLANYNSAFLYNRDGRQANKQYSKIHLVPFGEFVPFKKSLPFLYNLLMKFTPYDYDHSLTHGTEYTVFEMNSRQDQNYKFSVMICYEDAVPAIARRFALDEKRQKRIDWLVNISNDGWFVRFKDGKVLPSTELPQHTAICAFRAVENRLAVLRSVNTGVSCLIDTLGRVRNGFVAGTLPPKAMARTGIAGWFADKMPIDKRVTFFSKYGQWLDFCCVVGLVSLIIIPSWQRLFFRKAPKNIQGQLNEKRTS